MFRIEFRRPFWRPLTGRWVVFLAVLALVPLAAGCFGGGGGGPTGWAGPVVQGEQLYLGSVKGRVLAYDLEQRGERPAPGFPTPKEWIFPPKAEKPLEALYATTTLDGKSLFVGTFGSTSGKTSNGRVLALDVADGTMKWQGHFQVQGSVLGSPVLADDTLLVPTSQGKLHFLDPERGIERRPSLDLKGALWASPVVSGGVAYVASMDHKVYAVDIKQGSILKDPLFEAKGALASAPALAGDTLYFGSFDRNLYAVDASTGKLRWDRPFSAGGWFWSTPLVSGDTVYVGSLDHKVYALNAATGKMKWSAPFVAGDQIRASPVLEDGVLVVVDISGKVYGVDPATGLSVWPQWYDAREQVLAPLAAKDGVIYLVSRSGILRALEAKRGLILWFVRTDRDGQQAVEALP